jgi:hypothetical protein
MVGTTQAVDASGRKGIRTYGVDGSPDFVAVAAEPKSPASAVAAQQAMRSARPRCRTSPNISPVRRSTFHLRSGRADHQGQCRRDGKPVPAEEVNASSVGRRALRPRHDPDARSRNDQNH